MNSDKPIAGRRNVVTFPERRSAEQLRLSLEEKLQQLLQLRPEIYADIDAMLDRILSRIDKEV